MGWRRYDISEKCDFCHRKPIAFVIESRLSGIWRRWMCEKHLELKSRGLTVETISLLGK